jgi:WD40 repeat protein
VGESVARRAHGILKRLVAIEEPLRAAEAERLCAGDTELLDRVRQLLGALSRTDGFLESPIGNAVRERTRQADASPGLPSVPGFRIERLIGVGGMAAVYEATQELPRRRVALKILRRSMAGTAALRRFEFETEVLARLRHPGIAQIFEAGTFDDGAGAIPFFAMEYIESAQTLTQYAESGNLDLAKRLELMVQVCDAVQHGHQNGVIHRDLKPGNVLVDASGAPRVIDFGIARSIGEDVRGSHTTMGQIVGTLNAMSPEQCTPNAVVDARTDVYSLGVLLYELLCRRTPHDLGSLPVPEALRIIHDVAPTRPSAIDARLRGDLEAIVLKAIEKDPERRYRTVAAFGTDIRRYLDHETIEARSPTILYQLRLFARRNRAVVLSAMIVAAALIAATGISIVAALRAGEELEQRIAAEQKANDERDTALRKSYVASITGAISAQLYGDSSHMSQLLEAAPIEHRGWEWRLLNGFITQSERGVDAHRLNILSMAAFERTNRVVTVARDGGVGVWSLPDLEPMSFAEAIADQVIWAAIVADGERVVLVTRDRRVLVRSVASGDVERTLDHSHGECTKVSPTDGNAVVLVTDRGELLRWDLGLDTVARVVRAESGDIDGITTAANGRSQVMWSGRTIQERDSRSLALLREWTADMDVGAVLVRSDLDRVAIGLANGQVSIRSIAGGNEVTRLVMRDRVSLIRSLAMSGDGSRIAVGQGNGVITLVALPSTDLLGHFIGHSEGVFDLAFFADDGRLLSSSWDGSVRMWNGRGELSANLRLFKLHEGRVLSVSFDPSLEEGRVARMVSASADGTANISDADSFEAVSILRGEGADLYDAEFSPDGTKVATAGSDDTVRLWDPITGAERARLVGHTSDVWAVSFSPDGTLLASASDDGTVRIWDVAMAAHVRTLVGHVDRVTNVAFSHDGTRVASTSRDGSVRIWSLNDPERPRVLLGHEWDVFAAVWGGDDSELFTGSRDQTVRVWSTATGQELAVMREARQFVTSLALSPDGSRLVAGTWFGSLALFDPRTREHIASMRALSGTVRGISFSADGHRLAVASSDGLVRVYDDRSTENRRSGSESEGAPE